MTINFRNWAGKKFVLTGTPDTFFHLMAVLQECEEWNLDYGYEASAKWARDACNLISEKLTASGYFDR